MQPTSELYGALQLAYEHFNRTLFSDRLPSVIFTAQRQKGVMGYFAADRWVARDGSRCHEIAINPQYVGRSALIEVFQTIVHEQCHLEQHCFGKPGRRGYHNKEWASMMEAVGLMPSTTGQPGGKKTGEKMNDYPVPGGRFIVECEALVNENFILPWVDRYSAGVNKQQMDDVSELGISEEAGEKLMTSVVQYFDDSAFVLEEDKPVPMKSKYTCPNCASNLWGKPGLKVGCLDCKVSFSEISC